MLRIPGHDRNWHGADVCCVIPARAHKLKYRNSKTCNAAAHRPTSFRLVITRREHEYLLPVVDSLFASGLTLQYREQEGSN